MDNQHRQINGYRELTQAEIDLMNEVKQKEAEILALHERVLDHLRETAAQSGGVLNGEPYRWAAIAKTDIQTGFMALVRAVARPGE